MENRDRLSPVSLAGKEPVAEFVVDLGFSEAFRFGLGGEGFAGFVSIEAIEIFRIKKKSIKSYRPVFDIFSGLSFQTI